MSFLFVAVSGYLFACAFLSWYRDEDPPRGVVGLFIAGALWAIAGALWQ